MSLGVARSLRVELHDHVVQLVVPGEGADVAAAQQRLQRRRRRRRTGTPRSSARSRSKLTVSSGLLTRRSVSTLTSPLICRARGQQRVHPVDQQIEVGVAAPRTAPGCPQPNAGGLLANANTPGMPKNCPCTSPMMSCTVRVRSRPVDQVAEDDPAAHAAADVHHAEVALDVLGLARGSPRPAAGSRRYSASDEPSGRDDER